MDVKGRHLVIDAYHCDPMVINDADQLKQILTDVVQALGMQILGTHFHRFQPQGVTGVILLSTSHISIHTWPELNYAALDIFTCGDSDPGTQVETLLQRLSSTRGIVYDLTRSERSDSSLAKWEVRLEAIKDGTEQSSSKKEIGLEPAAIRADLYDQLGLKELLAAKHPVLFDGISPFQHIQVIEAKDIRMYLDQQLQFSSVDERMYHEAIVHPAFAYASSHKRVLILGGGDGLALREVLKYSDVAHVDLVDIDSMVLQVARSVPEMVALNEKALHDPRVVVHEQDAVLFLAAPLEPYDIIIVDFPDPADEMISKLYTKELFAKIAKHLKPDGVMVCQSFSPEDAPRLYWSIGQTLQKAGLKTKSYHVIVPSFGNWGFHLAAHQPLVQKAAAIPVSQRTLPDDLSSLFVFPEEVLEMQEHALVNSADHLVLHILYQEEEMGN